MNLQNQLLKKNSMFTKIGFLLFFGVALFTEIIPRYYHRAALKFTISEPEIMCFILICLLILNPKGIRIILLGSVIMLQILSIRNMLLFHSTNVESLPLLRAFSFFGFNQVVLFFGHQVFYFCLIFVLFKKDNRIIKESKT
jgi:hypothetical protein